MARATLLLALLLMLGGCVGTGGGSGGEVSPSASPSRYNADPDKPKRVCESTMIGNEPKTICY